MPSRSSGLGQSKPSRYATLKRWARVFWASPTSLVGLLLALMFLLAGAEWRRVDGVLEVALKPRPSLARSRSRPRSPWRLPFSAITFGHVVLGISPHELDRLRAHEHTHVRQCERWGPLFLPAYLLAGAWQWVMGRRAYWDNPFEVDARRLGGC